MRHIFVDASSRHVVFSTRHHGVFSCFISVSRHASPFFKGVIKKFRIVNFKLMKTCFNAETHSQCGRANSPLSAQRSSSPPLATNLTPPHPAVFFHFCLRSNSPLPAQRSSYTPVSLFAVKFTPLQLRPAVILHPSYLWSAIS